MDSLWGLLSSKLDGGLINPSSDSKGVLLERREMQCSRGAQEYFQTKRIGKRYSKKMSILVTTPTLLVGWFMMLQS